MNSRPVFLQIFICLFAVACVSGCAAKADPAPSAGFIPAALLKETAGYPFHKAWVRPNLHLKDYHYLYVAPIDVEHIRQMTWWQEFGNKGNVESDLEDLARYTQEEIKNAFINHPAQPFRITSYPAEGGLALEFALTEVVPNKAVLEAMTYAFAPLGLVISTIAQSATHANSQSYVAFEAIVRDNSTQEIVATFADREGEQGALMSVRGFSWYGHAKNAIRSWAEQLVAVFNKAEDKAIPDRGAYTLKPW
ncbi:MAG: hypothetical protein COV74_10110 [Candidatus Omnitrophica bacterium CG11_big_fil_rev_8_21_14_0_20_45_26]|uniref:DUF3313 domain-containing protein n=1 Tax=Candidatus Abzuiibacterium crystallinum TaxID=1974748 RepID=A0A2H0LL93_9BACT|nr:MAG: hypothetical protein COV74_10110 [Candidatus Omnitrophica bacterium CG11_big_fil_rev_8_21_14_0_20_45_26]PIW63792.1 MAG: hypothetical protein COW12_08995 [Candidatus Omnitrophica bacterium CG12_big_fil_rev_8_21_14_0_65_45_16]